MKYMISQLVDQFELGSMKDRVGQRVSLCGTIHIIRKVGGLQFIILRIGKYLLQCILETSKENFPISNFSEGSVVKITGSFRNEPRAPGQLELGVEQVELISHPESRSPISINKKEIDVTLKTNFDYRPITLRHPKLAATFRIQAALAHLFRESLRSKNFVEIFSPKIVYSGAEGGANIFRIKYFDKTAFLAQSPQFYKQMMVGVYGRVFEVGPVFRAEPHDTARHLNEYVSLDLEMGPINNFEEILMAETYVLNYTFRNLLTTCPDELVLLEVKIPNVEKIPTMTFAEVLEVVSEKSGHEKYDIDGECEKIISDYIHKQTGSEMVFVTHYPSKLRPMYAKDDPAQPDLTLSFDLIFRGLEITTGGQRISDYQEQVDKMKKFGFDPANFESYLQIHKYGIPPHGGLGMGLERLTAQLLGLKSVKEASLFPRTITRLVP